MSSTKAADRFRDRVAVVTGASRGIGLEITRLLVTGGARVVLVARNAAALDAVAGELGSGAIPVACDVTREPDVSAALTRIRDAVGDPDILVNNAGSFSLAAIETMEPSSFGAAIGANLVAPFRFVRAFLPGMYARGRGDIVTIGSIADRHILPGNAAYAASKHGVRALHEVLRAETRGTGVRATLVSPGPVDTTLWDEIDPDSRQGFTPRAEMLRPVDVANAVLYALSQPNDVTIDELRLSRS